MNGNPTEKCPQGRKPKKSVIVKKDLDYTVISRRSNC